MGGGQHLPVRPARAHLTWGGGQVQNYEKAVDRRGEAIHGMSGKVRLIGSEGISRAYAVKQKAQQKANSGRTQG